MTDWRITGDAISLKGRDPPEGLGAGGLADDALVRARAERQDVLLIAPVSGCNLAGSTAGVGPLRSPRARDDAEPLRRGAGQNPLADRQNSAGGNSP